MNLPQTETGNVALTNDSLPNVRVGRRGVHAVHVVTLSCHRVTLLGCWHHQCCAGHDVERAILSTVTTLPFCYAIFLCMGGNFTQGDIFHPSAERLAEILCRSRLTQSNKTYLIGCIGMKMD